MNTIKAYRCNGSLAKYNLVTINQNEYGIDYDMAESLFEQKINIPKGMKLAFNFYMLLGKAVVMCSFILLIWFPFWITPACLIIAKIIFMANKQSCCDFVRILCEQNIGFLKIMLDLGVIRNANDLLAQKKL
jgi:hypothetical protein